ncbi:MAG: SurA N-terminal domain-containing protein [Chitinophagaceae bacterium]|nr:SurA N-terminal domain-containing protein [Chitinophagaceae bacterium]
MGLIGKIREKTSLTVGIIGAALILFLLGGDLLGPGSILFGEKRNVIGTFGDEDITIEQYQAKEEEIIQTYRLNTERMPSSQELESIKEQTWNTLIRDLCYKQEFEELGMEVTPEEIVDMVQGNNIHPQVQQIFTDPETGILDRNRIIGYLQSLPKQSTKQQISWYLFEKELGPNRITNKYDNLITHTNYITQEELKNKYRNDNKIAEIKYLFIPYNTISDAEIKITDDELETYLQKHKNTYQKEQSRGIQYITFPIIPSSEDTAIVKEEVEKIKDIFQKTDNDSIFATLNSDNENAFITYTPNMLTTFLRDSITPLKENTIVGPKLQNGVYTLYKLSKSLKDTVEYARASHILIKPNDNTDEAKQKAKDQAQKILNDILKNPDSFEEQARLYGTDGTVERGGDLGWFQSGRMVKPFENTVFSASKTGVVNTLTETDFGFHIIKVTELKTSQIYQIAIIEKNLNAGDETKNEAYKKADIFALNTKTLEDFHKNATDNFYYIYEEKEIKPGNFSIGVLTSARSIVTWLYNEGEIGKISNVFELENDYVIAVMTQEQKQGTANIEAVKNNITYKVTAEKKAELILAQIPSTEEPLEEIQKKYPNTSIKTTYNLKISDNIIEGVGPAYEAIGTAFALQPGKKSKPIKTDNGIVIIELLTINTPPEPQDYQSLYIQMMQQRYSLSQYQIFESIKKYNNIQDKRYKAF